MRIKLCNYDQYADLYEGIWHINACPVYSAECVSSIKAILSIIV